MTLYHTITKPQPTVLIITLSGANYDFSNESIRVIVTPPSHQATCLQWREVSVVIKSWRLHSLCWWPAQVSGDLHQGNLVDCAILPTRAVTQAPPPPRSPPLPPPPPSSSLTTNIETCLYLPVRLNMTPHCSARGREVSHPSSLWGHQTFSESLTPLACEDTGHNIRHGPWSNRYRWGFYHQLQWCERIADTLNIYHFIRLEMWGATIYLCSFKFSSD